MIEIDKKQGSELRFLTPPKVEVATQKKYCRFKKMGIKYIDYKDASFLMRFLIDSADFLFFIQFYQPIATRFVSESTRKSRYGHTNNTNVCWETIGQ